MGVTVSPPRRIIAGEDPDGDAENVKVSDNGKLEVTVEERRLLEQILEELRLANFHHGVLSGIQGIKPSNVG